MRKKRGKKALAHIAELDKSLSMLQAYGELNKFIQVSKQFLEAK